MLRAILESLVFIAASLYEAYSRLYEKPLNEIRVDGGVANNDFILQKLSNITGARVIRYKNVERTALGAAYLAGIANGFWSDVGQIVGLAGEETAFKPDINYVASDRKVFSQWKEVVPAFCK
uniref:Carbohydrate kinase FGGY C-terminal domain-containing protein n=1 Tax=Lygus hesperus TaxID=30085 RepID=A0A0K8SST3_LYGHE